MKRTLLAVTILAVASAACGGGGGKGHMADQMNGSTGTSGAPPAAASPPAARTVDLTMVDIAYQPATLSVHRGDRVEFVFHNQGRIPHEAFIGDAAAQAKHEKEMGQDGAGSMGAGHMSDAIAITVQP